jgi:hypothetical protein
MLIIMAPPPILTIAHRRRLASVAAYQEQRPDDLDAPGLELPPAAKRARSDCRTGAVAGRSDRKFCRCNRLASLRRNLDGVEYCCSGSLEEEDDRRPACDFGAFEGFPTPPTPIHYIFFDGALRPPPQHELAGIGIGSVRDATDFAALAAFCAPPPMCSPEQRVAFLSERLPEILLAVSAFHGAGLR